jgi:tripartite-type tricarboxylate transporter receptor subunit TctC
MATTPNRTPFRVVLAALTAALTAALLAACGGGGGGSGPFAGEDVDLVVPYEPGGGYDAYARAFAPYLEDCLDATIVVRNEPGAGGLVATNRTATAGPDENRVQIVNTVGLVSAQIAQAEGVSFDLERFSWIGRIAAPPNVVVVATGSPIQSLPDLMNAGRPVRFVTTGPGSNDYIAPNILGAAYGFPLEIVTGFAGAPEARAAVVAGNADAHILPVDSQLSAIESGDVRPIVTLDEERDPLVPDTPTVYEAAAPDDHAKTMIDDLVALGQTGRALMASPELAPERVDALRAAFQCAVGNADLIGELERQQRPLDPLDGPATAKLVGEVLTAPEEFRQMVVASY